MIGREGYKFHVAYAIPERGLEGFKQRLKLVNEGLTEEYEDLLKLQEKAKEEHKKAEELQSNTRAEIALLKQMLVEKDCEIDRLKRLAL